MELVTDIINALALIVYLAIGAGILLGNSIKIDTSNSKIDKLFVISLILIMVVNISKMLLVSYT